MAERPLPSEILGRPAPEADTVETTMRRQENMDPADPSTWPDVVVIATGLIFTSVCTGLDDTEQIEAAVNAEFPTGITSRWTLCRDKSFGDGTPHPAPCPDDDARWHYLLSC